MMYALPDPRHAGWDTHTVERSALPTGCAVRSVDAPSAQRTALSEAAGFAAGPQTIAETL